MKKAKFPSSILRKPVLAFLATNDKAGLAQAWNFRDVCSFYFILLAKESELNKPQQWLLLCPQRSAPDKNFFSRSCHISAQHQPVQTEPARLAWRATWGKDKDTEKVTTESCRQRENTHFPRLFTWSPVWRGLFVLIFLQQQGFWSGILLLFGWYFGCQKLTLPFSYFSSLLITLESSKHKQPEPISQLRAL